MSSTVNPVINKRSKVKTEVEGLPPASPTTQVSSQCEICCGAEAMSCWVVLSLGMILLTFFAARESKASTSARQVGCLLEHRAQQGTGQSYND